MQPGKGRSGPGRDTRCARPKAIQEKVEHALDAVAVRPLSDEAAVVRIENRFRPGDRAVVMTAAFVRHEEDWQIVAAQASLKS